MQKKRRSITGLTLVLAALTVLAVACTSAAPVPGGPSPSGGAAAPAVGKPKYGMVMNLFIHQPIDDINVRSGGCATGNVHQPSWEGLLRLHPDNVSKTALAESWSSQDAQTYVFKLRQDVVWHDGNPFSAADVIATFDHMKKRTEPPNSNFGGTFLKDNQATYRAIDAHTVELKVASPSSTVIPWLSSCSTMIGSKSVMDRNGGPQEEWALGKAGDIKDAVGTGPFKVAKHARDTEIVYEKQPNYWGKDASGNKLPFLNGVHLFVIKDTALQFAAFRTNQVDMWKSGFPIVATSDADTLKAQLGDKITVTPGNANLFETLDLNNNHPLLKQRDMRWAINLIVDRQELTERAAERNFMAAFMDPELLGKAAMSLEEAKKMPGFRQPKTEDFAEARRLLEKLGVTPQTPVELGLIARNTGFPAAAVQVIARQLEPFGIKAKTSLMEEAAWSALYRRGDWDMATDLDSLRARDTWFHMYSEADFSYRAEVGLPWADKDAQKKMIDMRQEALRTVDEAKRIAIYHEMQRYLYTVDTPHITLGWDRTYHMWWNHVKGYDLIGGVQEGQRYDAVWLDK